MQPVIILCCEPEISCIAFNRKNFDELTRYLEQCSAFEEPEEGKLKIIDSFYGQAAKKHLSGDF